MPRGNRRDAARPSDQPDWDACIAWRRMVVALMNASWDVAAPIGEFLHNTATRVGSIRGTAGQAAARQHLQLARGFLYEARFYDACASVLEARSLIEQVEGPDRIELMGRRLCIFIRQSHPLAPPGFERVGRMRNTERGRGQSDGGGNTADPVE